MNKLSGVIKHIKTHGSISLVEVGVDDSLFSVTVIDTPQSAGYLREGRNVILCFKENEVIVAKIISGIVGIQNKFLCTVSGLTEGEILGSVQMDFYGHELRAIITSYEVHMLDLKPGDKVYCFIKANEISITDND